MCFQGLQEWENAEADYLKAIELKPVHWQSYWRLGTLYARLEQWDKAEAKFSKWEELRPIESEPPSFRALLRLAMNDRAGYATQCDALLRKAEAQPTWDPVGRCTWAFVLAPHSMSDSRRITAVAELLLRNKPNNPDAMLMCGAAYFRAGQLERALKLLSETEAQFLKIQSARAAVAYTQLFLSMAHHHSSHSQEARQWLTKALARIDAPATSSQPSFMPDFTWNQRLSLQLLRREAEERLGISRVSTTQSMPQAISPSTQRTTP
jgi:tetratricopeptide (TPR) repeat protein